MTPHDPKPGQVIEDVPVFPLPQVVLFPGALMPLHIFEPRYRAMTRDVLDHDRRIVIAQIPDNYRLDQLGQPEFCTIASIGEVVRHDVLPDGRYNMLVRGIERVALEELPLVKPYRRARATVLATVAGDESRADRTALEVTARSFASVVRSRSPAFEFALPEDATPGALADQCAHYLVVDGGDRQKILETLDDAARVRACLEALMRQNEQLGTGEVLH